MKNYYALYKGDTFIDLGTREHLAELLHCNVKTISHLCSPAYRRRMKEDTNARIVIKIEEGED